MRVTGGGLSGGQTAHPTHAVGNSMHLRRMSAVDERYDVGGGQVRVSATGGGLSRGGTRAALDAFRLQVLNPSPSAGCEGMFDVSVTKTRSGYPQGARTALDALRLHVPHLSPTAGYDGICGCSATKKR